MAYITQIQVRFRDTDGLGHVNNATFLSYCEVARLEFYRSHFEVRGPADIPFILASTHIDYRRPLELEHGPVEVVLTVPRIGNTSWDYDYDIRPAGGGANFAEAKTVIVSYDYENKATQPIAPKLRQLLEALTPR